MRPPSGGHRLRQRQRHADSRRSSLSFLERLQIAAGIATFFVMIVLIALITV